MNLINTIPRRSHDIVWYGTVIKFSDPNDRITFYENLVKLKINYFSWLNEIEEVVKEHVLPQLHD